MNFWLELGLKLVIMLEETGFPYKIHKVNIGRGEQFDPEYLNLNPNNKIPTLVDTENEMVIFESGAELMYLAVDQDERSSGVGQQLVEHFSQKLSDSGVTAYELSVDTDNENAIRFYDRLGFVEVNRYREFGIEHNRYRLELA